jgi:hypothetical protein
VQTVLSQCVTTNILGEINQKQPKTTKFAVSFSGVLGSAAQPPHLMHTLFGGTMRLPRSFTPPFAPGGTRLWAGLFDRPGRRPNKLMQQKSNSNE